MVGVVRDQDIDLKQMKSNGFDEQKSLIFTYGTLKRGFSNHTLMQELIRTGDSVFIGSYQTVREYPLVCGPYRVPFLIDLPGSGHRVLGELYAVSPRGLARIDELEGTSRAHYQRLPIMLSKEDDDSELTHADAYYAHPSYATELWNKNGRFGFACYSEKEARGYVNRRERPPNLTFLDHIRLFLSASGN